MRRSMRWTAAAVVALAAGSAVAQPERGRFRMFGEGMMQQEIPRRSIERAAEDLGLTREQRDALEALYEGYRAELRDLNEQARTQREAAMEKFREERDPSIFEGLQDTMRKSRDKRAAVEAEFMTDVQALLSAEQAGRWERVQAGVKREQAMRRGRMAGERVEIGSLLREMNVALEGDLAGTVEQYHTDLDRALAERDRLMENVGDAFARRRDGNEDEIAKAFQERREASEKVRDVNKRFARQVQDMLPEARREEFARRVEEASYPEVYRETRAKRVFDAANAVVDLTDDQKLALADVQDAYNAELKALQPRMREAWDKLEGEFTGQRIARDGMRGIGEGTREIMEERRALDGKAIDQIRKILTPEQADSIAPAMEEDERDEGPRVRVRAIPRDGL
ncbi:MAG TPA: Spy/CpxP family protein refolding chaperone [Phycisphaerales bacterium]|nr:Spy/CpxP family protein refolding chaperone [Phycisphaerales bacterium]